MARLNPKRRRMVKQAALFNSIVAEHGPAHDDSSKLQRGSPRTSQEKMANRLHMRAPSFSNIDVKAPAWIKIGAKSVYQGHK
jgi:hypothetical protein